MEQSPDMNHSEVIICVNAMQNFSERMQKWHFFTSHIFFHHHVPLGALYSTSNSDLVI